MGDVGWLRAFCRGLAGPGLGLFEVEILGIRRAAKIALEPLFDPTGSKMRG